VCARCVCVHACESNLDHAPSGSAAAAESCMDEPGWGCSDECLSKAKWMALTGRCILRIDCLMAPGRGPPLPHPKGLRTTLHHPVTRATTTHVHGDRGRLSYIGSCSQPRSRPHPKLRPPKNRSHGPGQCVRAHLLSPSATQFQFNTRLVLHTQLLPPQAKARQLHTRTHCDGTYINVQPYCPHPLVQYALVG